MNARSAGLAAMGSILALGLALAARGSTVPPAPTRFVTDEAHALRADTVTQLERELREYQSATGHQILVYIGETTGTEPLETYTVNAAQSWKAGRKKKDDGAVLFLFMRDHRVRIEIGYGLEGELPDARAKEIIDETIVPQLKADNPDAAVASGVGAILATVSPGFKPSEPLSAASAPNTSSSGADSGNFWLYVVLFVLATFLLIALIRWFFALPGGLRAADRAFEDA